MFYRMILSLGLFAIGYYLGREVGRTEAVRERMRQVRESGGPANLRDSVVIDMEQPITKEQRQAAKH